MTTILSISGLTKTYASGLQALRAVDLEIREGEIFALLGPNGAGKTTLISIACGIVRATSGRVSVAGHDIETDYRGARAQIGLVPQELTTDTFETRVGHGHVQPRPVRPGRATPPISRRCCATCRCGTSGHRRSCTLSGGMKRRVLIAKALSHEPEILFLDEPTAGVDVELRRDMWRLVDTLRERWHDDHPDHALHRGGRGDGRPRSA